MKQIPHWISDMTNTPFLRILALRLILILISLSGLSLAASAQGSICSPEESERLEAILDNELWRTRLWNLTFSWGNLSLGLYRVATADQLSDNGPNGQNPRAVSEVAGIRSVLSGANTLLKPIPIYPAEGRGKLDSCERYQAVVEALRRNRRVQEARSYWRLARQSMTGIAISSYVIGNNYGSWESARIDGYSTLVAAAIRLYLMPHQLEGKVWNDVALDVKPLFWASGDKGLGLSIRW